MLQVSVSGAAFGVGGFPDAAEVPVVTRTGVVDSIDGFDAVRDVPGRRARRRGDVRGMRGAARILRERWIRGGFGFGRNDWRR